MSDIWRAFLNPIPTLKSDVIYECPLGIFFQPDIGPERNFAIYLFGLALIMGGNENEIRDSELMI